MKSKIKFYGRGNLFGPASGFGVGPLVHFLQLVDAVMRIHLCGSQAAMAQQFLDRIEVCPAVGQVGGKAMPEYVRTLLIDGGY